MSFTGLLIFFACACDITLVMKYFFGFLKDLVEIYKLIDTLDGQVEPLNE